MRTKDRTTSVPMALQKLPWNLFLAPRVGNAWR